MKLLHVLALLSASSALAQRQDSNLCSARLSVGEIRGGIGMYKDPVCRNFPETSPVGCQEKECRYCRYPGATEGSPLWPDCPNGAPQTTNACMAKATPGDVQQGLGLFYDPLCTNQMLPGCRQDTCRFCRTINARPGYEEWPMCPGDFKQQQQQQQQQLGDRYVDSDMTSTLSEDCPIECPAKNPWYSPVSKVCKPRKLQDYYVHCASNGQQQVHATGGLSKAKAMAEERLFDNIYQQMEKSQNEIRDEELSVESPTAPSNCPIQCKGKMHWYSPVSGLCKPKMLQPYYINCARSAKQAQQQSWTGMNMGMTEQQGGLQNIYGRHFGTRDTVDSELKCPLSPCPAKTPWYSPVSKECKPRKLQDYYILCGAGEVDMGNRDMTTGGRDVVGSSREYNKLYDTISDLRGTFADSSKCPLEPCPANKPWWSPVSEVCKPKKLQDYYVYCADVKTTPPRAPLFDIDDEEEWGAQKDEDEEDTRGDGMGLGMGAGMVMECPRECPAKLPWWSPVSSTCKPRKLQDYYIYCHGSGAGVQQGMGMQKPIYQQPSASVGRAPKVGAELCPIGGCPSSKPWYSPVSEVCKPKKLQDYYIRCDGTQADDTLIDDKPLYRTPSSYQEQYGGVYDREYEQTQADASLYVPVNSVQDYFAPKWPKAYTKQQKQEVMYLQQQQQRGYGQQQSPAQTRGALMEDEEGQGKQQQYMDQEYMIPRQQTSNPIQAMWNQLLGQQQQQQPLLMNQLNGQQQQQQPQRGYAQSYQQQQQQEQPQRGYAQQQGQKHEHLVGGGYLDAQGQMHPYSANMQTTSAGGAMGSVPTQFNGVCAFDLSGTLSSGRNSKGVEGVQACIARNFAVVVSTGSPVDYSQCCSSRTIRSALCPRGQCLVEPANWYFKSQNRFVDAAGMYSGSASPKGKGEVLRRAMRNNNVSRKQCVVLFDDSDSYRKVVNMMGFETISVNSGVDSNNVKCFEAGADGGCNFKQC